MTHLQLAPNPSVKKPRLRYLIRMPPSGRKALSMGRRTARAAAMAVALNAIDRDVVRKARNKRKKAAQLRRNA